MLYSNNKSRYILKQRPLQVAVRLTYLLVNGLQDPYVKGDGSKARMFCDAFWHITHLKSLDLLAFVLDLVDRPGDRRLATNTLLLFPSKNSCHKYTWKQQNHFTNMQLHINPPQTDRRLPTLLFWTHNPNSTANVSANFYAAVTVCWHHAHCIYFNLSWFIYI